MTERYAFKDRLNPHFLHPSAVRSVQNIKNRFAPDLAQSLGVGWIV